MFNTKERHASYTSREERERENEQNIGRCNVTLHNTNAIHIDTLIAKTLEKFFFWFFSKLCNFSKKL